MNGEPYATGEVRGRHEARPEAAPEHMTVFTFVGDRTGTEIYGVTLRKADFSPEEAGGDFNYAQIVDLLDDCPRCGPIDFSRENFEQRKLLYDCLDNGDSVFTLTGAIKVEYGVED